MSLGHGASTVRSGLVLHLDAANPKSYPGSGTNIVDISTNTTTCTLNNSSGYDSVNKIFSFPYESTGIATNWITSSTFSRIPAGTINDFTYCGFCRVTNFTSGPGRIWSFDTFGDDTTNRLNFYASQTNITIEVNNVVQTMPTFSTSLNTLNVWMYYSFTITSSGTAYNIYRWNYSTGSMDTNSTAIVTPGTIGTTVILGRRGFNTANYSAVDLGPQMMYNRALSATEITQNFEALRGRYGI